MNKEDLKIVFFGTPEFAVESLASMVDNGYNVVAVVTMPDKPAGRGHKMFQSPVKLYAIEKGIPVLQPVSLKDPAFVEELRSFGAQLFVVIAFRMLPEVVWQMPSLGTFNLHASLLPKYRGAAPINWAIINGDTVSGVTTFFLKHEIDTGDIISQQEVEITPDDNVGTLHDKLMHLGARLTNDTIAHIIAGDLKTTPQDAIPGDRVPCPAPKIFHDTCMIDWNRDATEVHNLVRGLSPYPAARTTIDADNAAPAEAKIFTTAVADSAADGIPGKIVINRGRMFVGCASGSVEILELQPTGKKRMATADWLRGARLVNPCMV